MPDRGLAAPSRPGLLFRSDVDGEFAAVEAAFEPQVDAIVFEKRPAAKLVDPEYLRRLAGVYELAGQTIAIELAGGELTLTVPGQPRYTLVPDVSGRFVRGDTGDLRRLP